MEKKKNPSCYTRDTGLIPGLHHSPCITATVQQLLKPGRPRALLCNKESHRNKKPEHRN